MTTAPQNQGKPGKPLSDQWTPYEPGGDDPDFFFPAAHLDRVAFSDRMRRAFSRHHASGDRD